MTSEELKAHRESLLAKARAYDLKRAQFGFTVTDVTPKGYGPVEASPDSVSIYSFDAPKTVERMRLESSIAEGKTILRGKISGEKREAVKRAVHNSEEKLKAL